MKQYLPPLSITGFILCSVASQLLLKAAGLRAASQESLWAGWLLNPSLLLSLCCLALAMPFWAKALRLLPLATAYSWTAFIYVIAPFCAAFLGGETLSCIYFAGLSCIVCGVLVATRSVGK